MLEKDSNTFILTMDGYPDRIVKLDEIESVDWSEYGMNDAIFFNCKGGEQKGIINHEPFYNEWTAFVLILQSMPEEVGYPYP